MLSETGITFAGYTISTFQLLLAEGLLLAFARGKRIIDRNLLFTVNRKIAVRRAGDKAKIDN
jgi:hypothetical protein